MVKWMLVHVGNDSADREVETYTPGTIEDCFAFLPALMQDLEMEEMAKADLNRIGARYHEFVGGTLILAAMD